MFQNIYPNYVFGGAEIVVTNTEPVIVKQYPVPFHTKKTNKEELEKCFKNWIAMGMFFCQQQLQPAVEKIESIKNSPILKGKKLSWYLLDSRGKLYQNADIANSLIK